MLILGYPAVSYRRGIKRRPPGGGEVCALAVDGMM
jgi:hypothetical protein